MKIGLKFVLLVGALSVFVPGCGDSQKAGTPNPVTPGMFKLNGAEFGTLDGSTLNLKDNVVSGSGSMLFRNPLGDEDNNFALSFSLEEGGSLSLVTNTNPNLAEGLTYVFTRAAGDKLNVELKAAGAQPQNLTNAFSGVKGDALPRLEIDVHGHGHTVVWTGGTLLDEFKFNATLSGRYWGLRLDRASVTEATVTKPKEQHGQ